MENDLPSLTVAELIERLKQFPPDKKVFFKYRSEDYWNTPIAGGIKDIEEGRIAYSQYHQMGEVIDDPRRDARSALIIS